jgi:glycosyltransferase involved in cell wall biosynthesis
MFSILIPSFNNIEYLKLCISSIKLNSNHKHQIIIHVNIGDDGTLKYLDKENIEYTYTKYNSGICKGINMASKLAKYDYIVYAHDDFYFCPNWDQIFMDEIEQIGHNNFYLSGTMMHKGQIPFECGDTAENFNKEKFLNNYQKHNFYDYQGSTWAPTLIHKSIWQKVGGFSEEFFPGSGSDPDFNMKLWKNNIRIFKGLNKCKVYHFGSIVLRKKIGATTKKKYGSIGGKIFLLKWGISIKFFKKFYLQSNKLYNGPLKTPNKNISYFMQYILCKIHYLYLNIFYKKLKLK